MRSRDRGGGTTGPHTLYTTESIDICKCPPPLRLPISTDENSLTKKKEKYFPPRFPFFFLLLLLFIRPAAAQHCTPLRRVVQIHETCTISSSAARHIHIHIRLMMFRLSLSPLSSPLARLESGEFTGPAFSSTRKEREREGGPRRRRIYEL